MREMNMTLPEGWFVYQFGPDCYRVWNGKKDVGWGNTEYLAAQNALKLKAGK